MYKSLERPVGGGLREWPCVTPVSHLLDLGVSLGLQLVHCFGDQSFPGSANCGNEEFFLLLGLDLASGS